MEEPTIQRALSSDLQVKGKFKGSATHPSQVFFDFADSSLDAEEAQKIDTFLQTSPPPAVVTAKASEEGGPAVNRQWAQRRGDAVAARIGLHGKRPQVAVAVDDAVDVPDYRFMRRVDLAVGGPADDACVLDPACEGRLVAALAVAGTLAERGRSAAADPQPPIRVALGDIFHARDDATAAEVAKRFKKIGDGLAVLAKPGGYQCRTPCTDPDCRGGTRAYFDPRTGMMVACPDLKETQGKSVAETVLHEAVHGTPDIAGDDFAYISEPLFAFLAADAALRNPDTFVEFTRAVTRGGRTAPRPSTGGFDSSFGEDEQRGVEKAVAWAIKRLLNAEGRVDEVYSALTASRKDPGRAVDLLDGVANERRLFKRHFGTTAPPAPSKAEDQWIVEGISNRLHELLLAAGGQPTVVQGTAVAWSRATKRLHVDKAFFQASVSQQARLIEWALILDDREIPPARHAGYLEVIDQTAGLNVSATEGPP